MVKYILLFFLLVFFILFENYDLLELKFLSVIKIWNFIILILIFLYCKIRENYDFVVNFVMLIMGSLENVNLRV